LIARVEGATDPAESQTFRAQKEGTHTQMLLAVLINQHTASAAEILAACLKDHHRAVLVGQRTYGRGIVQRIVPLKSSGGALRLTSAKVMRPNGTYIHRFADADETGDWGVQPSDGCDVRLSKEQLQRLQEDRQRREFPSAGFHDDSAKDPQLQKAVAELRANL
jgi:carboxyl-terminal processing protease